jgi:hypothetical protein
MREPKALGSAGSKVDWIGLMVISSLKSLYRVLVGLSRLGICAPACNRQPHISITNQPIYVIYRTMV